MSSAAPSHPRRAVLLANLGSPASPSVSEVRRYLREFLMDEFVLDMPFWKRWVVVNAFILPFRPQKTAEAYRKIWWVEGSPLIVISRKVQAELQRRFAVPIELAMRYQEPALPAVLRKLVQGGVEDILLFPLYPHYALSSSETVIVRVKSVLAQLAPKVRLKIVPPFYAEPEYIDALVASAEPQLKGGFDHLLFSFHGLPERHMRLADPTRQHCLVAKDCCLGDHPAHQTCYRAQAFRTVSAFAQKAGLSSEQYSVAFQSRLGRDPWLKPYTDFELQRLPARGVKRLLVICPSFVADCLETLEEIGLRGRESFRAAGGSDLSLIPCLNDHPRWIKALEGLVGRWLG